jgi:DMSO/TMAO reductase YedYZ heme-binding membrane subunit
MTSAKELWYLTRGSGVVALLLLTASVALGVLTSLRVRAPRWPRFAIGGLHRNLTLLAIVFVALHVVTTVADGYAPIGLKDALVPFASPYRPIWLGLGAVAFDLLLALVLTSYLRSRIGVRAWRAVHWLAYAAWPVALLHSAGTGSDARTGWFFALGVASILAVSAALLVRVWLGGGLGSARAAGAVAALAIPLVLVVWYRQGPAERGWAARAGTPSRLIASRRLASAVNRTATPTPTAPRAFQTTASGTIERTSSADGSVHVEIVLRLHGGPGGELRLDLRGGASAGGVSLQASGVSFVPATTRAVYFGSVTGLAGNEVAATVRDHAGDTLALRMNLNLDEAAGTAAAQLSATTPGGGEGER